jgi:hypothetical protein
MDSPLPLSLNRSRSILLVWSGMLSLACLPVYPLSAAAEATPCVAGVIPAKGVDPFETVWLQVGAQSCLKCHKQGGDAEDSEFILHDPAKDSSPHQQESWQHNQTTFQKMAGVREKDGSRLLMKASGGLDHGGEDVLKPGSPRFQVLEHFVQRVQAGTWQAALSVPAKLSGPETDFFAGVTMVDDRRLLRRLTLSLAGRLPTADEDRQIRQGGLKALSAVLETVMKEEAFYDRLAEAFNDIFLTRGYGDGAESALSYDHFSTTRHWTQKHDLTSIADEKARQKARYKLADDYRESLLREPMELVKHIVRENRPFTELATADYIMISPYTARGYGLFEEVKDRFKNVEDPFEYVPVRLPSLKNRTGRDHQESPTGFYPHAGMMSLFQYLRRYPTTETNRNRLRARMYYQHFLGVDVMELAARVKDAAAVSAKFEVPVMQASECVVCHRTLDPVAGVFQDYYSLEGVFGPRKDGWFKDVFAPGFEGEDLPGDQRWRALQWLGEHTVRDPRFATTMVEHGFYVLTGRKTLLPPKDPAEPHYEARLHAHQAQRREVARIAAEFVKSRHNFKSILQGWAVSPFYRADGLATQDLAVNADRQAELADVGLVRLLTPEQLERKVTAIFGRDWGRLRDPQFALLYGGIDSKEVTERATDPSGAMGAIQRAMANDVACRNVPVDFAKAPVARVLFPGIEPDVEPGVSPESDARIREAIVHLHRLILGRDDAPDSPEVGRIYGLFAGVISDARERQGLEPLDIYACRVEGVGRIKDPRYIMRAWRAVVTCLLRERDFLYE